MNDDLNYVSRFIGRELDLGVMVIMEQIVDALVRRGKAMREMECELFSLPAMRFF